MNILDAAKKSSTGEAFRKAGDVRFIARLDFTTFTWKYVMPQIIRGETVMYGLDQDFWEPVDPIEENEPIKKRNL